MTKHAQIALYDTTLRDGTQGEGINFSSADKLRIAAMLDDAGIHYIEGGYPASNERDREFFAQLKKQPLHSAKVCAFGMTMKATSKDAASDPLLQPLLEAQTPAVTLVGKSWDLQAEKALQISLERNIEIIAQSAAYIDQHVDELVYDAEHLFDGWKANPEYTLQTLLAAAQNGADWLVLCDTNGGTMPWEIGQIVGEITEALANHDVHTPLGIHCHNDTGNGIACSLEGLRAGARMVHGTVGGIGERTGNADLIAIAANLETKMDMQVLPDGHLPYLSRITQLVFELQNRPVPSALPFVGKSAFAHKGGMHTSAIARDTRTYEHIDPEVVGNKRRILVSDLAGRASIKSKLEEFGYQNVPNDAVDRIIGKLKAMENDGYEFEGADASLDLLFASSLGHIATPFEVRGFRTSNAHLTDRTNFSEATIEVAVDNVVEHTASFGNGPINAIDNAFQKALIKFFPTLEHVELVDYKVRVLAGDTGTASKVRVLITMQTDSQRWTTVGVSSDVIEASYRALADSYTWLLSRSQANRIAHLDAASA